MRKNLLGLDHAVLRVDDLDRAADGFTRMGFTLAPRGRHSLGTENHCLMFGFDYLELLWVPPGVAAPFYAGPAEGAEGMTGLALKTDDAAGLRTAWEQAGLEPEPLLDFSRPVDIEGGARREAKFRAVALPAARTPGGRAFACQHFTPELVWRPGRRRHPNTVTGINKVVIATGDPAAAGLLWGRVFDAPRHPIPGGIAINTGAAPVVLLTHAALAAQLPGVSVLPAGGPAIFAAVYLSTGDLALAQAALRAGGLHPVPLPDGSLALMPEEAHGVALIFK
ncbi:MAG: VOC family protein [Betaproteobacteria bacterium]|nr:VOC family protein [Betaproteobacteria bacterium]